MVFDAQPIAFTGTQRLALASWPSGARYWFDRAVYDSGRDSLEMRSGPPTAASAYVTPEGHVVRVAEPDGYLCGIVLTDVRRRLAGRGTIEVTLRELERLSVSVQDVAAALSGA